jgi:multiple sugar transport system permease protein
MWTFLLQPQLSPFTSLFQKMGLNLNLLAPSVVPISVGAGTVDVGSLEDFIGQGLQGGVDDHHVVARKTPCDHVPLDGASSWRTAWQIKVPMVRPAVIMTAVFSIIGTIQLYNEPAILRNSAPRMGDDGKNDAASSSTEVVTRGY